MSEKLQSSSDAIFEIYSLPASEAKNQLKNLIANLTPERQKEILENDSFINIAGALVVNADQRKLQTAKEIVGAFDEDIRNEAYDAFSKRFGLPVSRE